MNQFLPDYASHPGETLQDILDELGMSQAALAQRMGRPKKTINEIIQGKTAITADTALQLELSLGTPASFWLNREQHYREAVARLRQEDALVDQIEWAEQFPIHEMNRLGWIQIKELLTPQSVHDLLSYFGVANNRLFNNVWDEVLQGTDALAYRSSKDIAPDLHARIAWLRKGELDAQAIDTMPFDPETFRSALVMIRGRLSEDIEVLWPQIVDAFADSGVATVVTPELRNTRLFGASRWLSSEKALIQLSHYYKTYDQFLFSLYHEAGHILLHRKRELYLDDPVMPETGSQDDQESQADQFAADALVPPDLMETIRRQQRPGRYLSKAKVEQLSRTSGIPADIIVGRLQHDGILPRSHLNGFKRYLEIGESGLLQTRLERE